MVLAVMELQLDSVSKIRPPRLVVLVVETQPPVSIG